MQNYEKAITDTILEYFKQQETKIETRDFEDILISYFHHIDKRLLQQKRRVFISKELQTKIDNNEIEDKYLTALKSFKTKFEAGDDMNSHLSTLIYDGDFYDKLLITWGIHHIHLNMKEAHNESEMHGNRSNLLLFCIIKDDSVYFIDTEKHKKNYVFSTFNLLNIISENWIHLIEEYEIKNIIPGTLKPVIKEDKDINDYRKLNVNIAYQINSKYYMFIDKQLNAVGSSAEDTMRVLHIKRAIWNAMPKAPINPRNMEFTLNPIGRQLGVLTWYEGNDKKQVHL